MLLSFEMKFYTLLKIAGISKIPNWVKIMGVLSLLVLRKRVLAIYIDPTLSCNLKCKMCYFSDPLKRQEMHGVISKERINEVNKLFLPYAMKMQIGCGAEPTLYNNLEALIIAAKTAKVPYVSLTTNGQLIGSGRINLENLVKSGLDEITISLHGTKRDVYEELMPGANFDNFLDLIEQLKRIRPLYPKFVIRVNYTINSLNLENLMDNNFFLIWEQHDVYPDIIQLRPVQNMGNTDWNDFDLTPLKKLYDRTIGNTVKRAEKLGIKCLYPTPEALNLVNNEQDGVSSIIEDICYCYVSPDSLYKNDFDPIKDSFIKYHKRKKTIFTLLKVMITGAKSRKRNASKKLNYSIK